MSNVESKKTDETRELEHVLREHFPDVVAYRQNSASIRVRIIDERFRGKTRGERDRMVDPYLETLPEATQADITVLLLLTRAETARSMMNVEFEDPIESLL